MARPRVVVPFFGRGSTDIFGFDELVQDPDGAQAVYQMVPIGSVRTLEIATDGAPCVVLSRAPSVAKISLTPSSSGTSKNFAVFSGRNPIEKIFVEGIGEGTTEILVTDQKRMEVTARLRLSVKQELPLSMRFFNLSDSLRRFRTEDNLTVLQRAIDRVKLIYKNQANIILTTNIPSIDELEVEGNVEDPIPLEDKIFQINGKQNQSVFDFYEERFKSSSDRFSIIFAWTMIQARSKRKPIGGLTPVGGNFCAVTPDVGGNFITSRIAHEMMHAIGEPDEPVLLRHLMSADENDTWRMRRRNIDAANPTGLKVVIDAEFI